MQASYQNQAFSFHANWTEPEPNPIDENGEGSPISPFLSVPNNNPNTVNVCATGNTIMGGRSCTTCDDVVLQPREFIDLTQGAFSTNRQTPTPFITWDVNFQPPANPFFPFNAQYQWDITSPSGAQVQPLDNGFALPHGTHEICVRPPATFTGDYKPACGIVNVSQLAAVVQDVGDCSEICGLTCGSQ